MKKTKSISIFLVVLMLINLPTSALAVTGGGTFKKYTFDDTPKSVSADTSDATVGEQNALRVGEDYLDAMGFSYEGLIDQLEYEGFTHEEAVYACDILFERDGLPVKKGSKGNTVKEVQERLAELGFLDGGVDGIFGNGTESAVKAFQTEQGIEPSGIVDVQTYEALFEEAEKKGEEYSFIGKISLLMDMDADVLWSSASSAAFGAVVVMADIASEEIEGIEFDGIGNVYLAQITFKNEGEILAYYYFREESIICAIFNPESCEITVSEMEYDVTPKRAMYLMHEEGILDDYQIIDMDDIAEILDDMMG